MTKLRKRTRTLFSRFLTLAVILTLVLGTCLPVSAANWLPAAANNVTFNTLPAGYYYQEGMPLFDGNAAHLDEYLNQYLDWVGLEGACEYATGIRDSYKLTQGTKAGWIIPGGLSAADNVLGISTDFPSLLGLSQSWDKDLAAKVGDTMATEKMATLIGGFNPVRNNHNGKIYANNTPGDVTLANTTAVAGSTKSATISFSIQQDLRINPLNGRFFEGYGEDPMLSGALIDSQAKGFIDSSGTSADSGKSNQGGFYTRGLIFTKHFSVYNAEWFRTSGNMNASSRSIFEYNIQSALKGLISGSVGGVMTSFGRTNGIPNEISPYYILSNSLSKYGMYSSPDFNGENNLYGSNVFGNGYDSSYIPNTAVHTKVGSTNNPGGRDYALALVSLANVETTRASGTDKTDPLALYNLVKSGAYGITEADVRNSAKPLLAQMVRVGLFDDFTPGNGDFSKYYPWNSQFKDAGATSTYSTAGHSDVALRAARESVVLLKNDGALPLNPSQKVAVAGYLADSRFRPNYTASAPPVAAFPESGESPLGGILNQLQAADRAGVKLYDGVSVVAIQANDGTYLTSPASSGGNIVKAALITDTYPNGAINGYDKSQLFDLYELGQGAFALRSELSGKWFTSPSAASTNIADTGSNSLKNTTDFTNVTYTAISNSIPTRVYSIKNSDGTRSFATNFAQNETSYWTGRFFDFNGANLISAAGTISSQSNIPSDTQKFTVTTVKNAADEINAQAADTDVAIVFVGAIGANRGQEGSDYVTLDLADNDYKLVKDTAAAYKTAGKKTVVVVKAISPKNLQRLQDDPNVDAIIYQAYAGELENKGLAECMYGVYAPTGRLTSTWYNTDSVLPPLTKYALPESGTNTKQLSVIDPNIHVDMTDADAYDTKLTYMYADPATVTYPFGYGLSYSNFSFSSFTAPTTVSATAPFAFSVNVKNEGLVHTSEIVQLYARNSNPAYGDAMGKRLVSFEKVDLTPGETKTVTLTVDPLDMQIWDVNAGNYIVEAGNYSFMVATSSADADIKGTQTVAVADGKSVPTVDASQAFSVYDHSYAAHDAVYKEVSKVRTVQNLKAQAVTGGYSAVMSKSSSAWTAMPNVAFDGKDNFVDARVACNGSGGEITLSLDSPTNAPIATIAVPVTNPTTRQVVTGASYNNPDGSTVSSSYDYSISELDYLHVFAPISTTITGTHTLYVNFKAPDLRIDTLSFTDSMAPTVESVTVNPSTVTLQQGSPATFNFSATVLGQRNPTQAVMWTVSGVKGSSSINPTTGILSLSADEPTGTLTVIATSSVDTTKTGRVTVNVSTTAPPAPVPTSVTVTPADVELKNGDSFTFSARVDGTDNPSQSVAWTIEGGGAGTTISENGTLTIAQNETAKTLTIKATSDEDFGKYGTAAVTVSSCSTTLQAPASIKKSNQFDVVVGLSGAADISAQDITVSYNKDVFDFVGAAPIGANTALLETKNDTASGTVRFISANTGLENAITGDADLLTLTFSAKETGTGTITITNADVGDTLGKASKAAKAGVTVLVDNVIDKTALLAAIDAAQSVYNSAVEGISEGQYPAGTKAKLNTALNAAKAVRDNSGATDAEVSQAVANLNAAVNIFKALKITAATGDINNSGVIDIGDLGIIASHYGIKAGDTGWTAIKAADINGDGEIGLYELAFVAKKLIGN